MHSPLQGIALVEISQVSFGDRFAVLQIDLSVRGWIGAFATLAALSDSHQFPNYVIPS